LIAFAVGALTVHKLGPRCNVWCEAEIAEAAVNEFNGTDDYLTAAEAVVGEIEEDGKKIGVGYVWNTYDLLLLPSSFPYGGMENPNLTFINQSLICGDKSLTDVIAHEITHSWAGNLVTNSTWPDFFLNEGTTMYVERLILGHMHGEDCRDFEAILGYGLLKRTQTELLDEDPDWRKLRPSIRGVDPDDSFSRIPYEKGFLLYLYIESLLPNKKADVQKWLRHYFADFQGKSVTVEDWKTHLLSFYPELKEKVDWEDWLYSTELPTCFDPKKYCGDAWTKPVEDLVAKWAAGNYTPAAEDVKAFQPAQLMLFLESLINLGDDKISAAALASMNATYEVAKSRNVEVLVRWILLSLHNKDASVFPLTWDFVSKHGRGVYIRPTYKELIRLANDASFTELDLDTLKGIWKGNRSFYHNTVRGMFDSQLNQ
jgi:leukotriene-A4 hydrolase